MQGVIIEGVTASGKTRLFNELQNILAQQFPANSKFILSEHYSERVLEHVQEQQRLDEVTVLEHLQGLLSPLLHMHKLKAQSKFCKRAGNTVVLVVIERFLLSQVANLKMQNPTAWQMTPAISAKVKDLYSKADLCGLARIILVLPDEQLDDTIMSTLSHRNDYWRKHQQSIGDRPEIVRYYRAWQRQLLLFNEKFSDIIKAQQILVDGNMCQEKYTQLAKQIVNQMAQALLPQ